MATLAARSSHPHYKEFHRLHIHSMGQDYTEQKELLDKMNAKIGVDRFVATFSISSPRWQDFQLCRLVERLRCPAAENRFHRLHRGKNDASHGGLG